MTKRYFATIFANAKEAIPLNSAINLAFEIFIQFWIAYQYRTYFHLHAMEIDAIKWNYTLHESTQHSRQQNDTLIKSCPNGKCSIKRCQRRQRMRHPASFKAIMYFDPRHRLTAYDVRIALNSVIKRLWWVV